MKTEKEQLEEAFDRMLDKEEQLPQAVVIKAVCDHPKEYREHDTFALYCHKCKAYI